MPLGDLLGTSPPGGATHPPGLTAQVRNLDAPYTDCVAGAERMSTCLQRCNARHAQAHCGCEDALDRLPDNASRPTCDVPGTLCVLKVRGASGV